MQARRAARELAFILFSQFDKKITNYSKDDSDGQKPSRKGVLVLTKEVRDKKKERILKELYSSVESRYRDELASIASQITNLKG